MTNHGSPARRRALLPVALVAVAALGIAACGSDDDGGSDGTTDATTGATDPGTDGSVAEGTTPMATAPEGSAPPDGGGEVPDGPTITIGAQDFGESAILAEIYGQALADAGYPVEQQALGGFRDIVFTSFESGDINFTPEYAASALEFLNEFAGEASGDVDATVELLQTRLEPLGLVAFTPSPAVDSNSFVVTAETAEELGLENVSDLTEDLTLGGPPDCPENASCIPGLQTTYGLDLSAGFVPLDGGGPLTVAALEEGEIDVAILFSTDGIIADKGWVVLNDDQGLINADNITPVGTQELVDAYGDDFAALVDSVSAALTTEELTELNRLVGIELQDADAVAAEWLASEGLTG
jgi:glycine betaine/choline ABC-type transport system substrate-binding protein